MRAFQRPPEVAALEAAFARANEGGNGYAFVSAPLAVSALLDLLDGGAHILVSEGLQADVYRMIEGIRRRSAGLKVGFADMADLAAVEAAVSDETRLLWIEALAGPKLSSPDLPALARFARSRDISTVVDISAWTDAGAQSLASGAHIVFSAAPGRAFSEQNAGVRGGLVAFSREKGFAEDRFAFLQTAYDALPQPGQAAEMLRDLERLPEEMARRAASAAALADILAQADFVEDLFYPGGGAAELSLTLKGAASEVAGALGRLQCFGPGLAPGLPGTYWHYARRSHEAVPQEIRLALGIADGIVRIGVPAADAATLAEDFRAAFG
ncbi:MAG: PLP-dependent transferase [Nisaea sp.]|uniref:PLP-dependent transferase n=1 Tax=Nisaea sp. TaxID=2024842 RepID=UPI001B0502E8|nr:PLP-dependent transferase [Nisaea sp.]MBO6561517.1 PLP-dependent transferase [Nisaea sp.]